MYVKVEGIVENITFGINKIQRGRVLKEAVRVNTGSFGTFSG